MRANCEFKTTAAYLLGTIHRLMPKRVAKDAIVSISPVSGGIRVTAMSPDVNGATDIALIGRWDRTVSVSLLRLTHILQSYGQSNITVLFLDGRIFINRTSIDAIAMDPARQKLLPARPTGRQMELPLAVQTGDLFAPTECDASSKPQLI